MPYYLNSEDLYELLRISDYIKINHPVSTSKSSNKLFESYLQLALEKGISIDYSKLTKNTSPSSEYKDLFAHHELAVELISVLDGKIEAFSDLFWSLFDYRKNYNKSNWQSHVTQYYISATDNKFRNEYIKKLQEKTKDEYNLFNVLDYYISNVNYPEPTHVRWWYDLINKKEHKDKKEKYLNKSVPDFLKNLTYTDSKDIILQVKCISLFEQKSAIEEITKIYEKHKQSLLEPKLFGYLSALTGTVKNDYVDLYQNKSSIIYKEEFIIDPLYYTQQYDLSENKIKNFFTVVDYFYEKKLENTCVKCKVELDPPYIQGAKNTQAKVHIIFTSLDNNQLKQEVEDFKVTFKHMNRYYGELHISQLSDKSILAEEYKKNVDQVNNYIEKLELYEKLDNSIISKDSTIKVKKKI